MRIGKVSEHKSTFSKIQDRGSLWHIFCTHKRRRMLQKQHNIHKNVGLIKFLNNTVTVKQQNRWYREPTHQNKKEKI